MTDFGKLLRTFREQCHHPNKGGKLSQQWLGRLLGEEMGTRFSGATISYWESGESKIHADDRLLLTSLIKILIQYGGIKTPAEANLLLETGNYRALNEMEKSKIFPDEFREAAQQPSTPDSNQQVPGVKFLLGNALFNSPEEFQKIMDDAKEGPSPAWPRIAVALINKKTSQWTIFHVLKTVIWLWVWVLSYLLITPSLRAPKASFQDMVLYASGTLILPPLIGALVNTKNSEFWKEKKVSNSLTTRIYVHQGAYIGFHLGYFFLFPFTLLQNQLDLHPATWVEFIKMLVPILISYTSAQLVPYNLWQVYNHLYLKDGRIFFVFVILGPIWAWFFLQFNHSIGILTLLTAATLLVGAMALQYYRKGNTSIPILWVIIFYGVIFICQIASVLFQ